MQISHLTIKALLFSTLLLTTTVSFAQEYETCKRFTIRMLGVTCHPRADGSHVIGGVISYHPVGADNKLSYDYYAFPKRTGKTFLMNLPGPGLVDDGGSVVSPEGFKACNQYCINMSAFRDLPTGQKAH